MPDKTTLKIEGLDELQAALRQFPQEVTRGVSAAMVDANKIVRDGLADYPDQRYGVKQSFVSDAQRRGFFWHLAEGDIEVPYRRGQSPGSQQLGKSWTSTVKTFGTTVRGFTGTATTYASLVQGPDQTTMHEETGWKTVEQVLKEKKATIERFFGKAVQKILARVAARGVK